MSHTVLDIQQRLFVLGFDPGPLDGVMGPETEAAIVAFKKSKGLRARPYFGPITANLLFNRAVTKGPTRDERKMPPWMTIAYSMNGLKEIPGRQHNKKILRMWDILGLPFRDDETPWCAGYVGYCLEEAGIRSTKSAAARSYTKWEYGVEIRKPVPGCIVVFWRGKKNGWSGHVGFVVSQDSRGRINVLGGNQGNAVSIKPFDTERLLGYYWPKAYKLPTGGLPVEDLGGSSSSNEA